MSSPSPEGTDEGTDKAGERKVTHSTRHVGAWIGIGVLLALLALALLYLYLGWQVGTGSEISAAGYFAVIVGGLVTLALGIGLMALIFWGRKID